MLTKTFQNLESTIKLPRAKADIDKMGMGWESSAHVTPNVGSKTIRSLSSFTNIIDA